MAIPNVRSYACALFVLVFLLAVLPAQSADSVVKAPGSSFFDTGMRLCDVNATGSCNNAEYALAVAKFGSGGAAAAALSLLAFFIFIPVRFLCNGFGGKDSSHGCCVTSNDSRSYTRQEIMAVKIASFVVFIPIIIGVAIGFQANGQISTSISTITASIETSGDNILQSLVEVRDILLSLPLTSQSALTINASVNTAQDVDNKMHDAGNTVNTYDKIRQSIMIIGFALSLSLVAAGVVCAIFNLRVLAIVLGLIGFIVMTIIWVSFGIHLVADKFVYDVCVDVDLLTNSSTSNSTTSVFKTGPLADLWNCGDNSDFQTLASLVTRASEFAVNATCDARAGACGSDPAHWVCAPTPTCSNDTLLIVTDAQHLVIIDGAQNRTLRDCAANCANPTYKNMSIAMVTAVNEYTNYTRVYTNTILPLISCQEADNVINGFRDTLCVTLFDALFGVAVSNLIVGIFYVAFIILMVVGYKRFETFSGVV